MEKKTAQHTLNEDALRFWDRIYSESLVVSLHTHVSDTALAVAEKVADAALVRWQAQREKLGVTPEALMESCKY